MKLRSIAVNGWDILKRSAESFSNHKVMKLSGSLSYSTIFSMGPLLVVVISVCGLFLGHDAVENKIYHSLSGFMGADAAAALQDIIRKASIGSTSKIAIVVGSIALLFGATSIFSEIQDSINDIWGIKPKPKRGWLKMLQNRFLSFSLVVGLGFLLLVSLVLTSLVEAFSHTLQHYFANTAMVVFYIVNQLLTIIIVTFTFAVIYKVLPDARISWKDVIVGAVVTMLLFMLGKLGISVYISKGNIGSTFGAMGSLVILMLWIYYSSLILYFGAEFTKAYAIRYGTEIKPEPYAVTMKQVEVETGKASVQQTEEAVPAKQKTSPAK